MRESILLYKSQCDALRNLPPEQFKAAVVAIWDYGMEDIEPEGDPIAVAMVGMAKPLIDKNNRNYENGKLGGRKPNRVETEINRTETEQNRVETESKPASNPNVKGKRRNIKEISTKVDTKKRFSPPTREEVQEYIQSQGYSVDADKFVDFYTSKGWMVGKNPMKDWKAAVRTWNRSQRQELTAEGQRQETTAEGTKFNNFPQRDYDWSSMEQEMLKGAL